MKLGQSKLILCFASQGKILDPQPGYFYSLSSHGRQFMTSKTIIRRGKRGETTVIKQTSKILNSLKLNQID